MYIDINTIISFSALLTAVLGIGGVLITVIKWIDRQNRQDKDIKHIKEELYSMAQVQFAVLDGLKQLGCNGNVTKAFDDLQKHINKLAHEV